MNPRLGQRFFALLRMTEYLDLHFYRMFFLKSKKQIEGIHKSGKILARVLNILSRKAKPGVSLIELDNLAFNLIKEENAKPAFLGYRPMPDSEPFPGTVCLSLNEEIVHGIPRPKKLTSGDILKIDGGVDYKSFISDAALTVGIGEISPKLAKLIKTVKRALAMAIKTAKIGNCLGDIGWAIQKVIESNGFSVIKELTGHGVGIYLHEEPVVLNYGKPGLGMKLKEGMVLAIEPMASLGKGDIIEKTSGAFATADNSIAAHFEKTIAVAKNGGKILTPC